MATHQACPVGQRGPFRVAPGPVLRQPLALEGDVGVRVCFGSCLVRLPCCPKASGVGQAERLHASGPRATLGSPSAVLWRTTAYQTGH